MTDISTEIIKRNLEIAQVVQEMRTGDYVVLRNLGFNRLPEESRDESIRDLCLRAGALSMSGTDVKTDVWYLDETKSKPGSVPYHTDNPHFTLPEQIVGFWCVQSSGNGGENLIVSGADIVNWLDLNKIKDSTGQSFSQRVTSERVLFGYGSRSVSSTIYDEETGIFRLGNYASDEETKKLVTELSGVIEQGRDTIPAKKILMEPGDVLFFNNHTHLHARDPYVSNSQTSPVEKRLVLRTRII